MTFAKLTPCKEAILKTLSYSGVFKYPLSYYQLCNYLISPNWFSGKQIRKEIEKLLDEKTIQEKDGYYFLSSLKPVDINQRIKETKVSLTRNEKIFEILQKIPWIKMISVTGSAANYNNETKSDLDLLFITSKNRVWLTRGFVFLILKVINKLPKNHEKRELCPNIFIDESNLSWIKRKRNLYVAQNIISMQPILNKDQTYFKFIDANRWIKAYYTNFKIIYSEKQRPHRGSYVINLFEKLAMNMQINFMKRKMTNEIASKNLIHFNKNDNSNWILSKYKSIYKKLRSI